MRTLITFAALLLSAVFVQLGSGTLAPLDALSGAASGFSNSQIGLLGSAHFLGFFIGCIITPHLMAQVGHSRAFAALAALGAIAVLLHPVLFDPLAWTFLRIGTGITVAGSFTVIESWLQASVENSNRGRVLGAYRLVDLSGSLAAQVMIAFLEPASYISYNIVATFCCLCLFPLALTRREAPKIPRAPRILPLKAVQTSPLAASGVIVAGLTGASFRMVGPIFGNETGLTPTQIGFFLASGVLGGAVAQIPVGWIADKFDRRKVLIGVSIAALVVCLGISNAGIGRNAELWFLASFAFGAVTFPLYSISAAHANDFSGADQVVELNASLLFLFAVGAIASPVVAAGLVETYGALSLFHYVAAAHLVLVLFGFFRMTRRPVGEPQAPYTYMPRTTMIFSRFFKRQPARQQKTDGQE